LGLPVLPLQSLYQLFPGSEVFMLLNKKIILLLSSLVIFFASCAKVEYSNPLDPKSENYVGPDSSADDDGDGIANIYDKDSKYYKEDKDTPVIELLGKNPDTLRFKLSEESKYNEKIEQLKRDFKCYDPTDKTVDNSDVTVDVNVALFGGNNYNIKYSVSDTSGNYTRVIRDIVVIILPEDDVVPPSISPNTDVVTSDTAIINIGTTIDYLYYVYIHDLDNSVFEIGKNVTLEGKDEVDTDKVGVYKVKYTAEDSSGNESSYTIYFKVIDDGGSHSEAKIFVYYDGEEIQNGHTFEYTLPDVSFDLSLLTSKAFETVNNETRDLETDLDCDYVKNEPGQYHATFSIKDRDDVAPKSVYIKVYEAGCDTLITLELNGESKIEVEVGEKFEDPGFTAKMTKPTEKDVSSRVKVTPAPDKINTEKEGETTITYEIKICDGARTISKTRTVKVVKSNEDDTEPPEFNLKHSKNHDTVTVGTKYSDYKSRDTGNTVMDNVDGKISWRNVTIDTTGFKTSEAGKACSLVYTVEDAAGNEGRAVRTIAVIDKGDEGLLDKYGVPSNSPLATMAVSFSKVTVEGTGGPSSTNIESLRFDLGQNGTLNSFSINTKWSSSQPDTYHDLKSKGTFKFNQINPEMKLTSTGLAGFDGEYYVVYTSDEEFVWVEKTGKFAIIWE